MNATIWAGQNPVTFLICGVVGIFAVFFFITVFIADYGDAKKRAQAKRAMRRARKHFAKSAAAHKPETGQQVGI